MTRPRGFESAGSATAWGRTIERAVEPLFNVAGCADGVTTLAKIRPVVCPEPSFGITIASILGTRRTAEPAVDELDHRLTRNWDERDRLPNSAVPAKVHVAPTQPRPAKTSITPPSKSSTLFESSTRSATEVHCLPLRLDSPQLQAAAGTKERPFKSSSVVESSTRTTTEVRCLPPGFNGDARQVTKDTIERPANPSTPTGDAAGAAIEAPLRPTRLPAPRPDKTGSRFDSAIDRVANILGLGNSDGVKEAVRTVPRPGPAVLTERLAGLGYPDRVGAAAATERAQPASGTTSPSEAATSPPKRVDGDLEKAQPETMTPPATKLVTFPKTRRETSPGTSASGSIDGAAVRHAGNHQELPHVPDRERATAPLPTGSQARRVPAETGEPPMPGLSTAPVIPQGVERDHLERQMKSILDEAARRHGIEV